LYKFREEKKALIIKIENWLKEPNITEGRRKYLKGWRKKEVLLLSHSRKRKKKLNVVLHNGITIAFAKEFIQQADQILEENQIRKFVRQGAEILNPDQLQRIYGESLE
jgi:hypothetical protein